VAAATQVYVEDLEDLELSEEDSHHLSHVLRLGRGEVVVACDGAGGWRICRFIGHRVQAGHSDLSGHSGHSGRSKSSGAAVRSRLLEADGPLVLEPPPTTRIVVGFVPVKGERPEWVVQKLTELGVDRIAVMRSTRSVVRWDRGREKGAIERLRRVAREAAAQSRRAWLPELSGVLSLAQLRAAVVPGRLALAEPGAEPPAAALTATAVGPEGGWDDSERDDADLLVGLGRGILRAETAAVAAGVLMCALRDRIVSPDRGAGAAPEDAETPNRGKEG